MGRKVSVDIERFLEELRRTPSAPFGPPDKSAWYEDGKQTTIDTAKMVLDRLHTEQGGGQDEI